MKDPFQSVELVIMNHEVIFMFLIENVYTEDLIRLVSMQLFYADAKVNFFCGEN